MNIRRCIATSGLIGLGLALATVVVPSAAIAQCNTGVCGPVGAACTLADGSITTVQCDGGACASEGGLTYTCGSCSQLDIAGNVIGCGCKCRPCVNCL